MKQLFGLLLGLTLTLTAQAEIIYVDGIYKQSVDGRTWATAFFDLQDGLDWAAATVGSDVVVVAEGLYSPGTTRFDQFIVFDNTTLVGGYIVGNHWRYPTGDVHGTVLSGAIGSPSHSDNCLNVLRIYEHARTVVIQRLKIVDGHGGSPTHLVGFCGGGLFFDKLNYYITPGPSDISLEDIWIDNCFAETIGGGMYYAADSGAELNSESKLSILNLKITNCWSNTTGGASIILQEETADPEYDAVIHNLDISNCGSEGIVGGLGIQANRTNIELVNSQVYNCASSGSYGGFAITASSLNHQASVDITFCTFYNTSGSNNHLGYVGASLLAEVTFTSSILWSGQPSGNDLFAQNLGVSTFNNCFFRTGLPLGGVGSNNVSGDPLLDANLVPQAFSPVINSGSVGPYPDDTFDVDGDKLRKEDVPFDIAGQLRYRLVPDIGAHERQ